MNVSFAKYTRRMRLQDISRCPSMLSIGPPRSGRCGKRFRHCKREVSISQNSVRDIRGINGARLSSAAPGVVRKPTLPIKNKETWR